MIISEANRQIELKIGTKNIPVWVYGSLNNPKIIFLHGFPRPFSELYGDLPMRYLEKNYCCLAVDLPGFGKSKDIDISVNELITTIQAQIFPREKFILFGISYGGLVSLAYAASNPENISGVIIAGTPVFRSSMLWGARGMMKLPSWLLMMLINKSFRKREDFQKIVRSVLEGNAPQILKDFKFLTSKQLKTLKIPVLLLYGEQDSVGTISMGKQLCNQLPNARLVVNKDRSHGWLLHRIDETGFLEAIESFLKKIDFT